MNNTIMNAENLSKLTAILAKYDVFAQFIDDGEQYGAAMEQNSMVAVDFINTAREMGIEVSNETFEAIIDHMAQHVATEDAIKASLAAQTADNNKEETIMTTKKSKNDYTLGGKLPSTTWESFRKELMDRWNINVTGKKFVELKAIAEEALARETEANQPEVAPVTVAPAEAVPIDTHNFFIDNEHGDAIVKRIIFGGKDRNGKSHGPAVYTATKSQDPESNGKLMVTMGRLFAIVGDVYGVTKEDPNGEATIKGAIRTLCSLKLLRYKKYDGDHMAFFPTELMTYKAVQAMHRPAKIAQR